MELVGWALVLFLGYWIYRRGKRDGSRGGFAAGRRNRGGQRRKTP